jgi:hypothetical protein
LMPEGIVIMVGSDPDRVEADLVAGPGGLSGVWWVAGSVGFCSMPKAARSCGGGGGSSSAGPVPFVPVDAGAAA